MSRLAWRAFTQHLDGLSDAAVRELEAPTAEWPDEVRTTPGRWFKRLLDGEDEPRLRFVRSLDHVVFALPERKARLAWAATPWLAALTIFRLHDEAVGDEAPLALARSRYLGALREVALSTGMTATGAEALRHCVHLRALKLNRNRLGTAGVRHVAALPLLEVLHLGRNALDDEGLAALERRPRLRALDLDANAFTDRGLERLCASGSLAGLRELNLSNNPIGPRGCRALAACKDLATLETLFLHNCELTDDAVAILLDSPHLGRLGNLALSENRLAMRSIDALAATPWLSRLHELDVCHNDFDPELARDRLKRAPQLSDVRRFCT